VWRASAPAGSCVEGVRVCGKLKNPVGCRSSVFGGGGAAFGYENAIGLAKRSGLRDLSGYHPDLGLRLPDWHFFYAREGDTLDTFDKIFGLPEGSAVTVGRVYRPDRRILFVGETVAVPSKGLKMD